MVGLNGEGCNNSAGGDVIAGSATAARQEAPEASRPSSTAGVGAHQSTPTFGPGYIFSGNINNPWSHAAEYGKQGFACHYCGLKRQGGGATRLTEHLAGIAGSVVVCYNAPSEVQAAMRKHRLVFKQTKSAKKARSLRLELELLEEMGGTPIVDLDASDDEERLRLAREKKLRHLKLRQAVESFSSKYEAGSGSGSGSGSGNVHGSPKTPVRGKITKYLQRKSSLSPSGASTRTSAIGKMTKTRQPRIDFTCEKKNAAKLGQAWAKWFHANDIAGLKINCPLFRAALRLSQELHTVKHLPTAYEVDGIYLDANYMEMTEFVENMKHDWDLYGVTVMCDSWTGPTGMSIINFMVYCNGVMFFHKTVNATGQIQNHEFIFKEIKKVVVDEIGHKVVVQIVTDNGSNYKKACKELVKEYPHIYWQPCAAHTINLMLKDIGKFPEVDQVVKSAKRISRFFYNHNRLHAEMSEKIGGELIRPNATRFGTVFIFLQSIHDKKDRFRQWMVSDEWKNSDWRSDPDFDYVEACLTSSEWWKELKVVLDRVQPLYSVLRYADQQKDGTISGFKVRMMTAVQELIAQLGEETPELEKYMSSVGSRIQHMYDDTLMIAAAVLDPESHYSVHFDKDPYHRNKLLDVISRIADTPESGAKAMEELAFYSANKGNFGGVMARLGARSLSPATWWSTYGGDVPTLQKYAMRVVSHCVSSSGCERNWSTFALIHTKVRNRLSYNKLRKLVFVHYNLQLRLQQNEICREEKEVDPCALMMDLTLFDETNPIMDWMNNSWSESEPLLDKGGRPSPVIREMVREVRPKRKMVKVSSLVNRTNVKKGKLTGLNEEEDLEGDDDEEESEEESYMDDDEGEDEEQEIEPYSPGRSLGVVQKGEEAEILRMTVEARENKQEMRTRRSTRSTGKKKDVDSVYY